MPAIKTLQEYLQDHSDNLILGTAALTIQLRTENTPYAHSIHVIDDLVDLSTLETGYYLRFLDRGHGLFHLYGVEVLSKGNIIVHENIPRSQLHNHSDDLFKEQLITLDQEKRIFYRIAKTSGGGADLHEDLVVQYATHGHVGDYINSQLGYGDKLPSIAGFRVKKNKEIEEQVILTVPEPQDSEKNPDIHETDEMIPKKFISQPESTQKTVPEHQDSEKNPDIHETDEMIPKKFISQPEPTHKTESSNISAYNVLTMGCGFLAAVGAAALIVGALALASIITVIAPPVGLALIITGAVALGTGLTGAGFFASKGTSSEGSELDPSQVDSLSKKNV